MVFFVLAIFSVLVFTTLQQVNAMTDLVCVSLGLPAAQRAAALVDGDAFQKLCQTLDEDDPFYETTRQKLFALKEEVQCKYLYTMDRGVGDGSSPLHRFIIDGSAPPGDPLFSPLGAEEDISDYEKSYLRTWEMRTPQYSPIAAQSVQTWGAVLSAFAPIFNSAGDMVGIVGCDIDAAAMYEQVMTQIMRLVIFAAAFVTLGIVIYMFLLKSLARQNEELLELKNKADAASQAKSVFLANTSHEIRTPMNAIIGMSELALREEMPPRARDYVGKVRRAGNSLLSIINDILDFSKIESGKLDIANQEYCLSSLLGDCVSIIRARLEEKTLRLVTVFDPALPGKLLGDEARLRQITLNLLSNAVKYTREGTITFTVSTAALSANRVNLVIKVADTGIGITSEDLPRLFGEFNRLDSEKNRSVEGTGLGLVISRNLCRLMGGDITVESEYGRGSVFTAIIPQTVTDASPFTIAERLESAPSFSIRCTAPGARILVVDDLPTNLTVAAGLLAPYQAAIDTALSGEEAVKLVQANSYDLVLMDHMMPGMDGIEAVAQIRQWEAERGKKNVPLIALTANAVSGMKEMFLEKGFNDFLSKPIDISKLDEIITRWIPNEKQIQGEEIQEGGSLPPGSEPSGFSATPLNGGFAPVTPPPAVNKGIQMNKKSFFSKNIVLILFIVLFVVIFGITAGANVFMSFLLDTMTFNIEQRMKAAAQRLTDLVSVEELDTYRKAEDMQKPSYQALRQKLYKFTEATGILYAFYTRAVDGKVYYIVDNDYDLKTQVGLDTEPFDLAQTPWVEKCLREGTAEVSELGHYTPGWPGIYTAYAPVFDRDGKSTEYCAGVDIYDADIVFAKRIVTVLSAAQVIVIAAVFTLIFIFLIRFQALREIATKPEKNAIQRKFLLFSVIFFLILSAGGTAIFLFAVRQFQESKIEQSLNLSIESLKLRMANSVDAELQLSVKMADTPIIKEYFLNPGNAETRELALRELDAYRRNFKSGSIFWVSDVDKIFYYDGVPSYVVNPEDPATYWYNMTLYETGRYNFNINYNPELRTSNLWVNAPVFENGKPIGIVGTGIDLTSFLDSWNSLSGNGMDVYFFNSQNEITVARNPSLAMEKKSIVEHLGADGQLITGAAKMPGGTNIQIITIGKTTYAVSAIPHMDWYIMAAVSRTQAASDPLLTGFFIIIIVLALVILLVSNVFIVSIQTTVNAQNRRLLELADESRAANDAKSRFLATMSHEIRTPMNAVLGLSELALREEMTARAREYVGNVRHAGNNLISIINDILDFSKIESGKLDIRTCEYALSSLLGDCISIIRTRLGEKDLRLLIELDPALPNKLLGDESRVRQVILNLLSNAVKYTPAGTVTFTVGAEKLPENRVNLIIKIADTGIGIKGEDLPSLFGEFNRLDSEKNRGVEGTGLGLAITRRLCKAMGGDISVESEYGAGSVFTAIIPQTVTDFSPFTIEERLESAPSFSIRCTAPGARILVVDDLPTNLTVAAGLLAPYQAAIDTAPSGEEALKLVEANNYDLVLMDHMMPGMDGIEATARIRQWEAERGKKNVPIIALTANAVSGMKEMFLEKGFNDFLSKPIDISKLDEIILRWIQGEEIQKGEVCHSASPNGPLNAPGVCFANSNAISYADCALPSLAANEKRQGLYEASNQRHTARHNKGRTIMNNAERTNAAPLRWVDILKKNYAQVIFVFIAFFLVSVVSIFSHRSLTERNLRNAAAESLRTLEANIRASLHEPEATLISSAFTIQNMIAKGASNADILSYLTGMTGWLLTQGDRVSGFNGMYGLVRNEYLDGTGWEPGADYAPAERPWHRAAKENPGQIASTPPYADAETGEVVVSFAQELYDPAGASLGVISLDVSLTKVSQDIKSLMQSYGGYGVLHDAELRILAHPRAEFLDRPLASVSPHFGRVAQELAAGREVLGTEVQNTEGRHMITFYYRLYNGWYVGMLIPRAAYYGDMYRSDTVQIILASALAFALAYILLRLSAAKLKADVESRQKSSFLANMSHEIRTPMNAIVGMSELLLRGNLGEDERGYANDIKQAGNNLISIINDILDISKIEAGKLEIIPGAYLLPSLVNDVVSIIRMKLVDRPIRFYTNIDAYLPNGLEGDEVRVRQILLNLLSNAAKYTERGCISMTITAAKTEADTVCLKMVISDTGIGIKPEDISKLFGDFVQVDTRKNRAVEGTGLGLVITRRLCEAMGGGISVESEYGKGSTFTALIPQGADFSSPFAAVVEPEKKKVLVYEGRLNYARSVCWSLSNMRVPHTMVTTLDAFTEALFREEWYMVFSGYGLYPQIKPLMDKEEAAFPGGKKPPLALMVEWGMEAFVPGVRFVALPVQALSIANVLNGRPDRGYMEAAGGFTHTRFVIPEARLLIVDDIATNLKVAEGLLAPYRAVVDTCLSGPEAVELVKRNYARGQSYDLIFMDHMMPGMDGIEATALIRGMGGDYFKTVPIIALTANAVSGMREMFLSQGFSGFISKPIDVSKLDETLARWIPRPKQQKSDISTPLKPAVEEKATGLVLPGVDIAQGIALCGGTMELYKKVLSQFRKDALERLPLLGQTPAPDDLPLFVTQVHALKSAAAIIGAAELPAQAAALEAAGKAADTAAIAAILPAFAEGLAALAAAIGAALEGGAEDSVEDSAAAPPPPGDCAPLLRELAAALEARNAAETDRILEELLQMPLDKKTKEAVEQIANHILMTEYGKALETVRGLCGKDPAQ